MKDFLGNLSKNGHAMAKSTLFEVRFFGLDTSAIGTEGARTVSLLCHRATLPSWRIDSVTNRIYGYNVEMPKDIEMGAVSFSFYVDRRWKIAQMFENYREKMFNTQADWSMRYRSDYEIPVVQIITYDPDNKSEVGLYSFQECYVKSVNNSELNWAAANQVQEIQIELSYDSMNSSFVDPITKTLPNAPRGLMDRISGMIPGNKGSLLQNIGSLGVLAKNLSLPSMMANMIPLNLDTVRKLMPERLDEFNLSTTSTTEQFIDP